MILSFYVIKQLFSNMTCSAGMYRFMQTVFLCNQDMQESNKQIVSRKAVQVGIL